MTENELMKLKKKELVKMIQARQAPVMILSDGTLGGTQVLKDGKPIDNMIKCGFGVDIHTGVSAHVTSITPDDEATYKEVIHTSLF